MQPVASSGTILVIDDDDEFRESCLEVLGLAGHEAVGIASARDALDYLRRNPVHPALILLDVMMRDMDGWAFRTAQMADPALAQIPVLVLSASGTTLPEGLVANGFISKLVEPTELLAEVARFKR